MLNETLSNDLGRIHPGRAQYTHLLDDTDGSVLDDLIVWWVTEGTFDVIAANLLVFWPRRRASPGREQLDKLADEGPRDKRPL